jgi:uncharacterized protein DUF4288
VVGWQFSRVVYLNLNEMVGEAKPSPGGETFFEGVTIGKCHKRLPSLNPTSPSRRNHRMGLLESQKWYLAVLVVASRVDDGKSIKPLVDQQFRLIRATDPEAAYARALQLGAEEADSYLNSEGDRVRWEFVGLSDLTELLEQDLQDGTEVYSTIERADPASLVRGKGGLTVFWFEANKDKTAAELLGLEESSRARRAVDDSPRA